MSDGDFCSCLECGEVLHRKDNHRCPGSASDRLYELERRLDELESGTVPVRFKSARDAGLPVPAYHSDGASGIDMRVAIDTGIPAGTRRKVPLGFSIELPEGWEAQVRPRSGRSLAGLDCCFGSVDSDYRGEICATLINNTGEPVRLPIGERVCQLVIARVARADIELVDELSETVRGTGGHGSTGNT